MEDIISSFNRNFLVFCDELNCVFTLQKLISDDQEKLQLHLTRNMILELVSRTYHGHLIAKNDLFTAEDLLDTFQKLSHSVR